MKKEEIDFVIPWVDSNDPKWIEEFNKYVHGVEGIDKRDERYRDWDNLQYWFRGIEKHTPWVRKIHFITWGHLPKWLDTSNSKLNVVYHEDILEEKYLPVFNINPLEINLHKIKGLSEKFVYFNDDFFIINTLKPTYFFKKGLPRDVAIFDAISQEGEMGHMILNNNSAINRNFKKNKFLFKNLFKWLNYKCGINLVRSILLIIWPKFTSFLNMHRPQPFLKSTFVEVWEKESKILELTSKQRFRGVFNSVNQYLFRDWQLVSGKFHPTRVNKFKYFSIDASNYNEISEIIKKQKYSSICLNDSTEINKFNFEKIKSTINSGFKYILPDKSSFEK